MKDNKSKTSLCAITSTVITSHHQSSLLPLVFFLAASQSLFSIFNRCSPSSTSSCHRHHAKIKHSSANLKPYAITNVKAFIPLILDLNQLNHDSWCELFQTHYTGFGVLGHLDRSSKPKNADDEERYTLDSLVKMWIYGTLIQSLLNMVTKHGSTANSLWLSIKALFRDNKKARVMELDNEFHLISMGDHFVNEYYEKMKVTTDLLANIGYPVPKRTIVSHFLNDVSLKFDHMSTKITHKDAFPTILQT
ncbi:unnamed protein product [Lactuca virosa]|uniref:Uncharacterized protein n=1 Tax=Lactuca virosa TaxID=75947 RepID=A0AAU9N707_9ASTR|nr:unnamed protein product [Lactuca virosa]